MKLFVLHHEYERLGRDEVKFIGVYATRTDAEAAVARLVSQPGFCDWPEGFGFDEHRVGEDHWTEGFSTMVTIAIPTTRGKEIFCGATAAWHPGGLHEICSVDDGYDPGELAFAAGDVVVCEERVTMSGKLLVAVRLQQPQQPK